MGVFIVVNLSLFVTTGLISDYGYYFPLIALGIFLLCLLYLTFPTTTLYSNKSYIALFIALWIGIYFTGASIVYMVQHDHFRKLME